MACQRKNLYIVHRYLSSTFQKIGLCIGRHPLYFIFIPFLFTCIMAFGLFRLEVLKDSEYLYVPINGRSLHAKKMIDRLFPENATDFDPLRTTTYKGSSIIIASAKDGGSMLRESIFEELQTLHRIILDITVRWKGQNITYHDICMKSNGRCYENSILSLKDKIQDIRNKHFQIKYPLEINSTHINIKAVNLGGVRTDKGFVEDFSTVRLVYFVNIHNTSNHEIIYKWKEEFLKILSEKSFEHISISKICGISVDIEVNNATVHIIWYAIITGILMLTFACATCLTTDWVTSKPWIGVSACISSLFALVSAFGFLLLCGMDYADMNIIIPFIVLGIGLDDSFVLLAAWRRTDPKDSVEKRMSETYSEVTISITITSLTNFICALIGMTTPFRVIRIIGLYMSLSILMDYIYQVTFFGGCLAISGYREARNLHAIFFTPVRLDEKSGFLRLMTCGCNSTINVKEKAFMTFYKDKLGKILTYSKMKFLIISLYLMFLGGGIYLTKYVKTSLGFEMAFHKNSYFRDYLRDDAKYFSQYRHRIHLAITSPLDYSSESMQKKIEKLMCELENSSHVAGSNYTESWLRLYLNFLRNPHSWIFLHGFNFSNPEDFTAALRNVFLKFKIVKNLKKDIIFNRDGNRILASRFFIHSKLVDNAEKEKELFSNVWNIIDKYDLPIEALDYRFIFYDQIFVTIPTVTQSIAITSCLVILVFLIFIPNIFCALCIAFTIASIEVVTIGYMSIWGVTLYPAIMISLIVVAGFCTDYSAHISYAYVNSKEENPNDKLRDSLHAAGHAIVQGCLSSVLGIVVLIPAPYEIFVDVFKIFFIVMTSAIFHGIFLLPVIFSLCDELSLRLRWDHKKNLTIRNELSDHPNATTQLFK